MKTLDVLEKVLAGKRIRPNTQRQYIDLLNSLAKFSPEWPDNPAVINEWITSLSDRADTSVRMWFDYGKAAGHYMQRISGRNNYGQYKFYNPFVDAETPQVQKKKRRYFTADEVMRVIASCRFGYDREFILTLVDTTCRVGELVNLKGGDVDDVEGWINTVGKTGKRKYRLDVRVCKALKELAVTDDGYVFVGPDGAKLNEDSLASRARRIIIRAGITGKKLGAHSLRHAGAHLVARATRSALAVKASLQQDDIKSAMVYIDDVEQEIQQEISPLKLVGENAFNGNEKVEPRQIGMNEGEGAGTDVVLVEPEIVEGRPDYTDDMFPEIPDGREVRPLLRTDDLRLMRRIFVQFARNDGDNADMLRARGLMKRITRRTR